MLSEAGNGQQFAAVLERIEGWFKVTAEGYQLVNQRFDRLESAMHKRDNELDQKIELVARTLMKRMDDRFDQVDKRFEQVDMRFKQVDKRLDRIDFRLGGLEGRFDVHERQHSA